MLKKIQVLIYKPALFDNQTFLDSGAHTNKHITPSLYVMTQMMKNMTKAFDKLSNLKHIWRYSCILRLYHWIENNHILVAIILSWRQPCGGGIGVHSIAWKRGRKCWKQDYIGHGKGIAKDYTLCTFELHKATLCSSYTLVIEIYKHQFKDILTLCQSIDS